jgi:hypothetical protein
VISAEAAELIDDAGAAHHACDLLPEAAAGASARARVLIEVLRDADLSREPPRAIWNLLWAAAELTWHVDIYRAEALLLAVEALFTRHLSRAVTTRGELADAALMAFSFFFEREDQPLAVMRTDTCRAVLTRVAALDNPICRTAAEAALQNLKVTPMRP